MSPSRFSFVLTTLTLLTLVEVSNAQSHDTIDRWLGTWEGEMVNHNRDHSSAPIPVTLELSELIDGTISWRTVYNNDEVGGLRDYLLVPDSSNVNGYWLDEQNGIRLRAQLFAGVLVEAFEVGERQLISRYELTSDGKLVHEVTYWDSSDKVTTEGTGIAGENGTPVHSFNVTGIQRTIFQRIN